ncbi:hypothetical protein P5673_007822 [Acropora cervicornis]|uniref:Uncharacterized protein n=1 Tax=Acropora cervicornis TaxID=6130 RepID=A0AAD9QUW7_ACRCE|nr:hypothetical protein P5673_007822 [Acropora cervicornis]
MFEDVSDGNESHGKFTEAKNVPHSSALKNIYRLITIIVFKPECVDVNQLASLVQKVQVCILQLVIFIFSKQELQNIKSDISSVSCVS